MGADSCVRARSSPASANADLTAANAKVQVRYNLAVDAIQPLQMGERGLPAEAKPIQGAARLALENGPRTSTASCRPCSATRRTWPHGDR